MFASQRSNAPTSGAELYGGMFAEEYLSEFQWSRRDDTIPRMVTDPQVSGHLSFYRLPLLEAEWRLESASDLAKDKEIQEVTEAHFLRQGPREFWTSKSWRQRLFEILEGMHKYGFSLFWRGDRALLGESAHYQGFHSLTWLHPRTVAQWVPGPGGSFAGVRRCYRAADGTYRNNEFLAAEDLVLYIRDPLDGFWEGTSLIRPLWRPYKLKDTAERVEAIDLMRRGTAVPVATESENPGENERLDLLSAVKMLRGEAPEWAYVVKPHGTELGFIEPQANVKESLPIIERKILDMAAAMGNNFLQLGTTKAGARAVADPQMAWAMIPLQAEAKWICEMENNGLAGQPSLIQEFVDLNWSGVSEPPRLVVEKINPFEHRETIPTMIDLISIGALGEDPRIVVPILAEIVERLGWKVPPRLAEIAADPEILIDEREAAEEDDPDPKMPGKPGGDDPEGDPDDGKGGDQDDDAKQAGLWPTIRKTMLSAVERSGLKLPPGTTVALLDNRDLDADVSDYSAAPEGTKVIDAPPGGGRKGGFFRAPTPFEQRFIALATIRTELGKYEGRCFYVLREGRRAMTVELVDRVRSGSLRPANAPLLRSATIGPTLVSGRALKPRLRKLRRQVLRFGRQQVRDELRRQRRSVPLAKSPAWATPSGTKVWEQSIEQLETTLNIDVGRLIDGMVSEFLQEYERLVSQGLDMDQIADGLEASLGSLSERALQGEARGMTAVDFNRGRNAGIQEAGDDVSFVVRSEILDENTCGPCRDLDGRLFHVNSTEYWQNMPPAKCDGKERCRGFYLVVGKGQEV